MNVVCPKCNQVNRVPPEKNAESAKCGKCNESLFDGHAAKLDSAGFKRQVNRSDIPVLVDFWAPWCGPCKMMAPAFDEAAKQLQPKVRLAKVNTDESRDIAGRYGIRSIPTLILFQNGKEAARVSGAMPLDGLLSWVNQQVA